MKANPTTGSNVENEITNDQREKNDERQLNRRDGNLTSNYDVIIGLLQNGDVPEKSYNVKRCTGLEVCQALLLCCRNAIYFIDGFEQRGDGLAGEIIRLGKSNSTFNVNLRQKNFADRKGFNLNKKKEGTGQETDETGTEVYKRLCQAVRTGQSS